MTQKAFANGTNGANTINAQNAQFVFSENGNYFILFEKVHSMRNVYDLCV